MPGWVVIGVHTGVGWPTNAVTVTYLGHEITLRPETGNLAPSVEAYYKDAFTREDAVLLLRRFLSALAWIKDSHVREIMVTGGGERIRVGKGPVASVVDPRFRADYLPEPADAKAVLALALYRQALNVNSVPYQFLGFFKILNVLKETGRDHVQWINTTLHLLEEHFAAKRVAELRTLHVDVGKYLWESGRCAVAHAFAEPVINPDNIEDVGRLAADLPVIKALAGHFIEHELKVRSYDTYRKEHLYELDGFRSILGKPLVDALKAGGEVSPEIIPRLPRLRFCIRDKAQLVAFSRMEPEVLHCGEGKFILRCQSPDGLCVMGAVLDFAEERFGFDPFHAIGIQDDLSADAIEHVLDHVELLKELLLSGQLEIYDADTGLMLGRCDSIVMRMRNVDVQGTLEDLEATAKALGEQLSHRRASEGQPPVSAS